MTLADFGLYLLHETGHCVYNSISGQSYIPRALAQQLYTDNAIQVSDCQSDNYEPTRRQNGRRQDHIARNAPAFRQRMREKAHRDRIEERHAGRGENRTRT